MPNTPYSTVSRKYLKDMKTHFKTQYGSYLIGISIFFLLSFIPAKYSADFRKEKKGIDTLTIFNPIVQIVANNNRTKYIDSILIRDNQVLIERITNDLLVKKYTLKKALLPSIDINVFSDLFEQLENSSKTLIKISSRQIFKDLNIECKSKYALLLVYHGQYHPDFPPHYKLNAAMFSSTIVITPKNPTKSISDLRLLVIDTEFEEIVFYDRINSSKYDARVSSEVEQMTRNILRKIYYK
jgi:hypothetical protein